MAQKDIRKMVYFSYILKILFYLFLFINIIESRCIQWRATKSCDPHGLRDINQDLPCMTTIANGKSGYCECENRKRVREVTCEHHTFTCEKACIESSDALEDPYPEGFEYVTCGSTIKLIHEATRFRLHSHEISYGSGSGQQSVTAHGSRDDPNSYWMIKEGNDEIPCTNGEKIKCGSKIRLEHLSTRRNLHSHSSFTSPLSHSQEVSGLGVAGEGDEGDNWFVECMETQQCDASMEKNCSSNDIGYWKRWDLIRLKHTETGKYLSTGAMFRFDDSNCPRCPINGQLEISSIDNKDSNNVEWFADEGIFIESI